MKNSIWTNRVFVIGAIALSALTFAAAFVVSPELMRDAQAAAIYRTLAL